MKTPDLPLTSIEPADVCLGETGSTWWTEKRGEAEKKQPKVLIATVTVDPVSKQKCTQVLNHTQKTDKRMHRRTKSGLFGRHLPAA